MTVRNFTQCHARSRVSIGFSCTVSKIQNTGHSQRSSPWEVVRARFHKKCDVKFRSIFRSPSQKLEILVIPNVLVHGKSYEHGFTKKYNGHKLAYSHTRSRVSIDFSCTVSKIQNTGYSQRISPWEDVRV
ncbi:hypothetical protein B296_00009979 [Ensete ventricosum]|uniref:Uncharacterized protein n=1 Tax=Ensete ventricosum TaxID=4639 RepID=A0A426ZW23_ENSVE|nr:hypothetical protein B296_00009979 [Ensete ventricosum]